jgi:hypothetical protein
MNGPLRDPNSIAGLIDQLSLQRDDLDAVAAEMESPMLELCSLLVKVRELEKLAHPMAESKLSLHFVAGLQSHDLFSQRVQHSLKVIEDLVAEGKTRTPGWIYKATWLGGALVEEARREYVRGFNEVSMGLTDLVQAERQGYIPEQSTEIARPMSKCLAAIRGFGKRIRSVSNVLEALGTKAFAEAVEAGGEPDVASSFSSMLGHYSFGDEKHTHHLVLNLPVPERPELQPGDAILF